MPDKWAGVVVIVAIQIVIFFITKRRFDRLFDRLDESISHLETTFADLRTETAAFK